MNQSEFIPHLTVGYVMWTLLGGFITGSTNMIVRHQAFVSQGGMRIQNIAFMELTTVLLQFSHQALLILLVLCYYRIGQSFHSFISLLGLVIVLVNGWSALVILGILSLRFRDMQEVLLAITRMAFLITPIIWMAGDDGRSGLIGPYTILNPFYHFLEIVRAPLLGKEVQNLTWIVVFCFSFFGLLLSSYFSKRFEKQIPLWL